MFSLPYSQGAKLRKRNPRVRASHARLSLANLRSGVFVHSLQTFRLNTVRVAQVRKKCDLFAVHISIYSRGLIYK